MCICDIETKLNECDNPQCKLRYLTILKAATKSVAFFKPIETPVWRIDGYERPKIFRSLLFRDVPLIPQKPRPITFIVDDYVPQGQVYVWQDKIADCCLIKNIKLGDDND